MIEVKHQISIDEAIYDEMVTTEACHCAWFSWKHSKGVHVHTVTLTV